MNHTITYEDLYFYCRLTGTADLNGYVKLFEDITNHASWKPGSLVLTDETGLETSHLSIDDVKLIARECGKRREIIGTTKFATAAPPDLIFAMNRMWEVHVSDLWDAQTQAFRSKKEALEWLSV